MSRIEELKAELTITAGFLVLFLLFKKDAFLYVALGVAITALVFPFFGKGIVWLWYKLAEVLGWINSRILLSLVFFLILYPVSLLYKLVTKNPLKLKERNDNTLYQTRNHLYKEEDFKYTW